jgi:hypothetical protein
MLAAAWRWARADMRSRRTSLVALAAIVAVVVAAVLALLAGARRADAAFERYLATRGLPDILIAHGPTTPPELAAALGSDPRIVRVERATVVFAAPEPLEPGELGMTLVGTEGSLTGGFGRPDVVAGRYPDPAAADEVVVNVRAAGVHRFTVGQRVPIRAVTCDGCAAGPAGRATIVGIVRLATDLDDDPGQTGVSVAGPAFLSGDRAGLEPVATWLGVHVAERGDVPALIAALSVLNPDGDVADIRPGASLARAGQWQHDALLVAAGVVALAGAVVVGQALVRHLNARPSDPGCLAAMGMPRRDVRTAGILGVAPAVVVGVAAGLAAGVAASPLLPLGRVRLLDDAGFHVDGPAVLATALGGLLVLTLAMAAAADRWVAPPAVEPDPGSTRRTRLGRHVRLGPVVGTGVRFALAPTRGGRRLPVVPVVAATALASALVVAALVVRWSVDGLAGSPRRYGQSADLRVSFEEADLESAGRALLVDPHVRDVALARNGEVNISSRARTVQVATTGLSGLAGPAPVTVLDGRAPAGPREIAVAPVTMRALDLDVGDEVTATGPCGTFRMMVVGRVIVPMTGDDFPDDGSVLTSEGFDALCAGDLRRGLEAHANALVALRDPGETDSVADDWRARGLVVSRRPVPTSVTAVREVRPVATVGAVLVAVLGAASLAHALALTVRRRRHDLAVLRAVGLRPRQSGAVVVAEAATLALVAAAVGLPLGVIVGRLVWTSLAGASNVLVRVDVPAGGLVLVVVAMAAVAVLAAMVPARRASRLHPAAVLRSE